LGTASTAFTAVIIRHRVSPFGEPDDRLLRMIQYSRALEQIPLIPGRIRRERRSLRIDQV
jgi:hypothetical protein